MEERKFLTPREVASRYNGQITHRTLANWRSSGVSPPFCKIGGRILYPLDELILWEQRRTVKATNQYSK